MPRDSIGDQTIGQIIDGLGCQTTINDGHLVAGAGVITKIIDEEGDVQLSVCWSDGMSWVERVGMLRVAELAEHQPAE